MDRLFDIKEFMDYSTIISELINHPTELSLFEVTCILINNKINEKKKNDKDKLQLNIVPE
jgi:hypothetical protein